MRLSLIIPAYRAVDFIARTVNQARAALESLESVGGVEIIVVDDGSDDGTSSAAEDAGADRVIPFGENRGKGAAVRAGVAVATGDVVVFTDADLAYEPIQIGGFIQRLERGSDVVIGDRNHPDSQVEDGVSWLRGLGSRSINLVTRLLLGLRYSDTQCGLKAFKSSSAKRLFEASNTDGFGFDIEILFLARKGDLQVDCAPVKLRATQPASTVRILQDGFSVMRDIVKIRFRSGRQLWR